MCPHRRSLAKRCRAIAPEQVVKLLVGDNIILSGCLDDNAPGWAVPQCHKRLDIGLQTNALTIAQCPEPARRVFGARSAAPRTSLCDSRGVGQGPRRRSGSGVARDFVGNDLANGLGATEVSTHTPISMAARCTCVVDGTEPGTADGAYVVVPFQQTCNCTDTTHFWRTTIRSNHIYLGANPTVVNAWRICRSDESGWR